MNSSKSRLGDPEIIVEYVAGEDDEELKHFARAGPILVTTQQKAIGCREVRILSRLGQRISYHPTVPEILTEVTSR